MSTDTLPAQTRSNPAAQFRHQTTKIATVMLTDWVGEERAKEATGRMAVALSAAAASAKNPQDFYDCTPQSIASVIAISALTGIMVGTGATALAYAIPRRARKGEPPQLQYQLSHRGINALAGRADRIMIATPISVTDEIDIDDAGDVRIIKRDFDNPPASDADLRGIMLVVKVASTGAILMRQWIAKKVINERRDVSDAYQYAKKNDWAQKSDPWHRWYVEQAMKTAMHYGISRGWCVIDDTNAMRALNADASADIAVVDAPRIEGGSRTDQVASLLGGPATDEQNHKPEVTPLSEYAPGESESPGDYVERLKGALATAVTIDAVDVIVTEAQNYGGGDYLSDHQAEQIGKLGIKRMDEISKAAKAGQLV